MFEFHVGRSATACLCFVMQLFSDACHKTSTLLVIYELHTFGPCIQTVTVTIHIGHHSHSEPVQYFWVILLSSCMKLSCDTPDHTKHFTAIETSDDCFVKCTPASFSLSQKSRLFGKCCKQWTGWCCCCRNR